MCFTKHGRKINLLNYQELKNTLKSDRFTRENRWISPHIIERRKRVAQTRLFARLPEDILQQGDSLVEITGPSAIGKDTICRKLTAVGEVVIPSSTRRRRALPDLDVKTFCEEIE
jgi:hypothetical protein